MMLPTHDSAQQAARLIASYRSDFARETDAASDFAHYRVLLQRQQAAYAELAQSLLCLAKEDGIFLARRSGRGFVGLQCLSGDPDLWRVTWFLPDMRRGAHTECGSPFDAASHLIFHAAACVPEHLPSLDGRQALTGAST